MPGPEQRKNERTQTRLALRIERSGEVIDGETINLSLGGALVRAVSSAPPVVGERWRISIALPTLEQPLVADAEVRWVGLTHECGVQFSTGFRARETWALGQWLDRVRKGTT